jgi:toxin-antitoxin system PIN domain toxin
VLIADVTVFIGAHRASAAHHPRFRDWLGNTLNGSEPFGLSEQVLCAFMRVVTNHRAFPDATSPGVALDFCEAMRAAPASRIVAPGPRHWRLFADLVRTSQARASVVPDAYLAALAIENGATLITRDRGFARFPGLRILDPLAG